MQRIWGPLASIIILAQYLSAVDRLLSCMTLGHQTVLSILTSLIILLYFIHVLHRILRFPNVRYFARFPHLLRILFQRYTVLQLYIYIYNYI